MPGENGNNVYAKFGGTNKEYYGIFESGLLHVYSAFFIWIYSNAFYNTLWGTLPDCFMAHFTIFLM